MYRARPLVGVEEGASQRVRPGAQVEGVGRGDHLVRVRVRVRVRVQVTVRVRVRVRARR